MIGQRETWFRRRRDLPVWPLAVIGVIGLGAWGFAHLDAEPGGGPGPRELKARDVVYRTVRLFALEFDLPPGASAPWQLWLAAFLAPMLTLRGIARLFREQLAGVLTHYLVRPRMVIFGANERSATLVATAPRPGRWRDAIVVVDPDPQALRTVAGPRVWTVRGHGTTAAALRQVAVARSANLIVVTGDNARNSAITTAALDLLPTPKLDVYVEVEEPGLARTLEQGGHRVGLETVPFSASALAAAAVLDELEAPGPPTGRTPDPPTDRAPGPASLLAAGADGAVPTLALFGTGGLVDAFVLELHRRRQVQLLEDATAGEVMPRILLFGPDADRRRRSLMTLVGTELQLLDLDSVDVRLDQVVELDIETARHLTRSGPLRQVFVLAPSDLDGGGIAITLARHLGPTAQLVLVTGSGSTPFGDEIEEQTQESATLARVRLFRVPEYAYNLPTLQAERLADRLARALYAAEPARPGDEWSRLPPDERDQQRRQAEQRIADVGPGTVPLRRSALVASSPAEIPLLEVLGFDRPTALARAGLRADFQSVTVLVQAAQRLLERGHEAAFAAWCEVARLHRRAGDLARVMPGRSAGPDGLDVRELLLIRRAQLGDADARVALQPNAGDRPPGRDAIAVLAGSTDAAIGSTLLEPVFQHPAPGLDPHAVVPDGPLRTQLRHWGARTGEHDPDSTRRQLLGLWRDRAVVGLTGGVRVVALPDTATEDLLLARALGASLGRVQTPDAPDLSRALLNGAVGVVPLPADRMTVRSFLRPTTWPAALGRLRQPIAAELHHRYVARQRDRKPGHDPALQPWSALSPWLQRSNLAVVDDIPTKLAAVGLRLDGTVGRRPDPELLRRLVERTEDLAELEHGRYTAERLLSGWTSGVRDPARFLSPYLQPWTELSEEAKEYDREVVRDLPAVLDQFRVGVRPLNP
jgi:hypothetical protein